MGMEQPAANAHLEASANAHLEAALELLEQVPLIDGHNDLAFALRQKVGGIAVSSVDLREPVPDLHTDIPRMRAGRVGGQFWSVWVPAELPEERALPMALEQLEIADAFAERYPDVFERRRRRRRSKPHFGAVASRRSSGSRVGR
jgi:membrane dipeptidase